MTTTHERPVALNVISPDGKMRTATDTIPLPEARALVEQAKAVEPGPWFIVLVVPRPGREPRHIGRAATEHAVNELLQTIEVPLG